MTFAWMNKQLVMLRRWHNNQKAVKSMKAKGHEAAIEKPDVIIDYTENIGAVDCLHYNSTFTRKNLR